MVTMTDKQNFVMMTVVLSALSFGVALAAPPDQGQVLTQDQRREQLQKRRDAARQRGVQSQTQVQSKTDSSGEAQQTFQQRTGRNLTGKNKSLTGDNAVTNQADTNAERTKRLQDMRKGRNLQNSDDQKSVEESGDPQDKGKLNADQTRQLRLEETRKKRDFKTTDDTKTLDQTGDQLDTGKLNADQTRQLRLEEMRKKRDFKTTDDTKTLDQTGDQLDTGKLNADQARQQRLEEMRKKRDFKTTDDKKTLDQTGGQLDTGKLNADQTRQQRLEEMRKLRDGDTKKLDLSDKKDGIKTEGLQQVDRQKNLVERQDRLNKMRQGRDKFSLPDAEKTKILDEAKTGRLDRDSVNRLKNTSDAGALRQTMLDLRESRSPKDEIRKNYLDARKKSGGDMSEVLSGLNPESKGALVGANMGSLLKKDDPLLRNARMFDKDDALRRYGKVELKDRERLTEGQIDALRGGRLPEGVAPPRWGEYRRLGRPLDNEFNFNAGRDINIFNTYNKTEINNYYLPPAFSGGRPPNWGSFNWNYWDGRNYYDHSWAVSLFVGVGHVRYGGWDGCVVGGGYYSYGWGWIDGCIDYGGCRMWVPGLWAPYTTTECCECEQWIEPVYETVWTGCCWETVQVDGGYFAPAQSSDCRTVTRYRWIPGHFQFSYCG
jgi:hypothetical protein